MVSKSFALLLALVITSNSAIPTLSLYSNTTTGSVNVSDSGPFHCVKTTFFSPINLRLHSCIRKSCPQSTDDILHYINTPSLLALLSPLTAYTEAIYELPTTTETGIFHVGLPYNDFSLPVTEVAGRCRVTVVMAIELGVVADRGNWLQLGLLARDLNAACESRLGFRYQGGWARGGDSGGVVVRFGLAGHGGVLEEREGDGRDGGDA